MFAKIFLVFEVLIYFIALYFFLKWAYKAIIIDKVKDGIEETKIKEEALLEEGDKIKLPDVNKLKKFKNKLKKYKDIGEELNEP